MEVGGAGHSSSRNRRAFSSVELRANWVAHDSIETEEGRAFMIQKMKAARLNTLFVAMPPIGDNYGEGKLEDFFAFVQIAKVSKFVVFGWISNHKRTYPVPADLRIPEEREAQAEWVEQILNGFPCLDGIAIDYIRYPTWEASDAEKIDGVSLTVKAIREVTDRAGKTLLTTCFNAATVTYRGSEPSWEGGVPLWYQQWFRANPFNYFKMEATTGGTGVVNRANLGEANPNFLLGPSFMSYQQDPITWMMKGYVDHVVPMQYTADPEVMQNDIDVWESFTGWIGQSMSGIYLGLGWLDEPSSFPDSKFDPAAMVAHVKYGRAKGVGGYTIFRLGIPGVDDTPLIDALTTPNADNSWLPPFPEAADSPFPFFPVQCEAIPSTFEVASGGTSGTTISMPLSTFHAVITTAVLLCGILLR